MISDRMRELDQEILRENQKIRQAAKQEAVLEIASWAIEYWPRKVAAREALFNFLRKRFRLVGKCCARCKNWLAQSEFYVDKSSPDGRFCWCKNCVRTIRQTDPRYRQSSRRAQAKHQAKKRQQRQEAA